MNLDKLIFQAKYGTREIRSESIQRLLDEKHISKSQIVFEDGKPNKFIDIKEIIYNEIVGDVFNPSQIQNKLTTLLNTMYPEINDIQCRYEEKEHTLHYSFLIPQQIERIQLTIQ